MSQCLYHIAQHLSLCFSLRFAQAVVWYIQVLAMATIGVLALQGSFREHVVTLARCGVKAEEVRTAEELRTCDGLIIPGGESTTMAHVANTNGLLNELRDFVISQKKPVWGTCAGLIFLAESAEGRLFLSKSGHQ